MAGGTRIGTVVETFYFPGRGRVLLVQEAPKGPRFRTGEPVEIRLPDGTALQASIRGIDTWCGPGVRTDIAGVLINLESPEIPSGSEVWTA